MHSKQMQRELYFFSRYKMRKRAKMFGIASLVTLVIFIYFPIISFILAALAVLFAVLSKGGEETLSRDGKVAMYTGLATILIFVYIFGRMFYALKTNPEYRRQLGESMDQIYYQMAPEDQSSKPYSELLEQYFGNGGN